MDVLLGEKVGLGFGLQTRRERWFVPWRDELDV